MINFLMLFFSSEVSGPGGLFDIDATLPLIALEFVLLMVLLNILLYSPLLTVIDERKEYILTKLSKASELLTEANKMTTQYEEELASVRSEAQFEIANSQKIHKEILDLEINISQNYLDELLKIATDDFEEKRIAALDNLEESVQSLCDEINTKLSI
jgi:F-type H+-transporting ATPase subunit b|uniref:ATP synthase CF0 subunit II n=1 Tax=Thalassionema frauenfeldii TaxID=186022 RepID=UPI001EDEB82F|nr:ATP synthase CF0 subunit II [Thalassionema frauenfeldii]UHY40630.1 ATP synthase CF0 subunit II [Thalassionema frauenfeldii]UHY41018.1 ATP synthase CF0 subunit II [Thalassionema frauenfeldii]